MCSNCNGVGTCSTGGSGCSQSSERRESRSFSKDYISRMMIPNLEMIHPIFLPDRLNHLEVDTSAESKPDNRRVIGRWMPFGVPPVNETGLHPDTHERDRTSTLQLVDEPFTKRSQQGASSVCHVRGGLPVPPGETRQCPTTIGETAKLRYGQRSTNCCSSEPSSRREPRRPGKNWTSASAA